MTVNKEFVPRSLTFQHERERVQIDADTTLADPRLEGRPLILLGEAGSGKSELLRRWAGGQVVTAGQVIYGRYPTEGRLFVDGLDEAPGLNDGDALDRILGKLESQHNIDVVIACRIADWRSASGASKIKNWTGVNPVELTLKALTRDEIVSFLQDVKQLEQSVVEDFVAHYEERGLGEWLGNPQTLGMLADVIGDAKRPETTGDLFRLFVDKAWSEHRKQDTPLANASRNETLNALGALFAALIVGGYDALTLSPGASQLRSDLSLAECKALPGINDSSDNQLNAFLDSRLVTSAGNDRFIYLHRRIGEFLGARWLAEQARTDALRKRVLGALQHGGIVPSSLRGLWGWLADNARLAEDAIRTDPLAVIEYGDADSLAPKYARVMLAAIERAEDEHQSFGRREYRAASLVQSALSSEVERVLSMLGENRQWTQLILLQQMRNPETVSRHMATLRALMLDAARPFSLREAAAEALAEFGALDDWHALVKRLADSDRKDCLRLAFVMMRNRNVGLTLTDAEFAETAFAYSGLTPRFLPDSKDPILDLYSDGSNEWISDNRLDGILDALCECASRYLREKLNWDALRVERLFLALRRRRLALGNIDTDRLWEWLTQRSYKRYDSDGYERTQLNTWLQMNHVERRALQRKVLDSCSTEPRSLRWRLHEISLGLEPTTEDVVFLLNWLPEADARWSELIWFAPRREEGAEAREAARRHIRTEEDQQLLRDHAIPPPPSFDNKNRPWAEQQECERRRQREHFLANRQHLRTGAWSALAGPAHVYLALSWDADRDLPPEARIGAWIGEDLQADALEGFEAFLTAEPPQPPNTPEIAKDHEAGRYCHVILSAALAERQRIGRNFADLSIERVQAGVFSEWPAFSYNGSSESLRNALIKELEDRGVWADTARLFIEPQLHRRLFIEPQLHRRSTNVYWLWYVLASADGTMLAAEWLRNFQRISAEMEEEMIDHLLREGIEANRKVLTEVALRRRKQRLDPRRQRNWQAVEFLLGTRSPLQLPSAVAGDRSFLWVMRDRMMGGKPSVERPIAWGMLAHMMRHNGGLGINSSPKLLAEIVSTFSPLWPWTPHPSGVTTGDVNPWDATDFLGGCLHSLAADVSREATLALTDIVQVDFGYGKIIRSSIVDQRRARANAEWKAHNVRELAKLVTDGPPIDHADLQREVLAVLDVVQDKIRSSSEDVWRFFYANLETLEHQTEDWCSDQLVTLLKQSDRRIVFDREKHLGDDREGDISCTSNELSVAVECKGQWHPDLWTAYDRQLSQQQAVDWRAGGYGIYVVYWFGEKVGTLTGPPRGTGIVKPRDAAQLEASLNNLTRAAGLAKIAVKVLDVSRPF